MTVITTVDARVTYEVRVLGRLWMPGVVAAQQVTIPADAMSPLAADDELIAEADCWDWCHAHLGDFAGIDALDIRRVDVREDVEAYEQDGASVTVRRRTAVTTQVVAFTDEQEDAWFDCMAGPDEDDQDDREDA
jgi:hypothetical protein